tara:strand:+ start:31283 stop:31504 length:222 start_codon:yes stop_codon:yes gene_type:complete
MSDNELMPCPFCGGKAITNDYDAIVECGGNIEPCCTTSVWTEWNDRSLSAAIAVIEANGMVAVPVDVYLTFIR